MALLIESTIKAMTFSKQIGFQYFSWAFERLAQAPSFSCDCYRITFSAFGVSICSRKSYPFYSLHFHFSQTVHVALCL